MSMWSNPQSRKYTKLYLAPSVAALIIASLLLVEMLFWSVRATVIVVNPGASPVVFSISGRKFEVAPLETKMISIRSHADAFPVAVEENGSSFPLGTVAAKGTYIANGSATHLITTTEIEYVADQNLASNESAFSMVLGQGLRKFANSTQVKVFDFTQDPPSSISLDKNTSRETRYSLKCFPMALAFDYFADIEQALFPDQYIDSVEVNRNLAHYAQMINGGDSMFPSIIPW